MTDEGIWSRASGVAVGLLLIAVGVVFLVVNSFGMVLPFDLAHVGWPAYVILPGVALLVIGLLTSGEVGVGLSVAGGIVATVGGVLAYQVSTGHWASWAYAWALVVPGAVGASTLLWAILHRRASVALGAMSGLAVGLVLFMVGFGFFESVLNLGQGSGLSSLGRQALPIGLIAAGALIVISRMWPRPRRATPMGYGRTPDAPPAAAHPEAPPPAARPPTPSNDTDAGFSVPRET